MTALCSRWSRPSTAPGSASPPTRSRSGRTATPWSSRPTARGRLVDHHRLPGVRRLGARGPPHHDGRPERRGVGGRHGGLSGDLPDQRPLGPPSRHHHQPCVGELDAGDRHRVPRRFQSSPGNVQSLVSAANQLLSTISTDTAYNTQTKTAGPLNGDPSLTSLAQQVLAAVGEAVGTSGAGSDGTAGESAGLGHHQPGDDHLQPDRVRGRLREEPDRRPVDVHRGRDLRRRAAGLCRSGLRGRGHRRHVSRQLCRLHHPVGAAGGRHRLARRGPRRPPHCPRPRPTR